MNKATRAVIIIFSDLLILLGLIIATKLLNSYLIPYINAAYSLRTNIDSNGNIFSYLFSGTSWFSTSLQGYELPEHSWYLVLAIAAMVQTITGEVESCLSYSDIDFGKRKTNFIKNEIISFLIVSPLTTAFMLQLMIFFILAICPQNIPFLFIMGELVVFCLPAWIHKYLIKRDFSLVSLIFGVINVILLYAVAKTQSSFLVFVIYVLLLVKDFIESKPSKEEPPKFIIPGVLPFWVYSAWIIAGIIVIRPVVTSHMPTIERTVEEVYVSDMAIGENRNMYIRTDGSAVDESNTVLMEDVKQIAITKNAFYLTNDGVLHIKNGENYIPKTIMENVVYIANFSNALIVITGDGDVYGYGDFNNYLTGGPFYDNFELLISGYNFVKGDMGMDHILLVDEQGDLYSLGCNSVGELGTGSRSLEPQEIKYVMSNVKSVAAGLGTSYAITNEGELYAWGRNEVGQLGTDIHVPSFKIGNGYAVNDAMVYADTPHHVEIEDVKLTEISVGIECAFALDEDGNVWTWGHGVTKASLATPTIVCSDIIHIYSDKYTAALQYQYLYMIDSTNTAVRKAFSDKSTFDVSTVEVIIDTSDWMPEPIQEVSTILEDYLDKFYTPAGNTADNTSVEEEPQPSQLFTADPAKNYSLWYKEFNGHTYRIYDEFMYMKTAEAYCESMGGHLVTITSQEEMDFVLEMMEERKAYPGGSSMYNIGLSYNGSSYSWLTKEDTSFVNANHANQAFSGDNGEGVLRTVGGMNVGTMGRRSFICEWDD